MEPETLFHLKALAKEISLPTSHSKEAPVFGIPPASPEKLSTRIMAKGVEDNT
jgi:hypothetical protein